MCEYERLKNRLDSLIELLKCDLRRVDAMGRKLQRLRKKLGSR